MLNLSEHSAFSHAKIAHSCVLCWLLHSWHRDFAKVWTPHCFNFSTPHFSAWAITFWLYSTLKLHYVQIYTRYFRSRLGQSFKTWQRKYNKHILGRLTTAAITEGSIDRRTAVAKAIAVIIKKNRIIQYTSIVSK